MQRMSVLKGIKKIRCFWKLFWNIKWNVELMSCICAILLPWKYLSGVSLSTNHRSNLLLICTNNFSKPTHSAWVFTNFTSFKGNSKMDDNPMWKHEYGTTKQKRSMNNLQSVWQGRLLESNKVSHWDKTFSSWRSLHICRYSQNRWSQNALVALEI